MRMKGGRDGLKNRLDLEINSVFSISRKKANFFNIEMCDLHKTQGRKSLLFFFF